MSEKESVAEDTGSPWTRWWWPGSAVSAAGLRAHLEAYAEAGLGGVEITPIYGAKGFESRSLAFMSEAWMEAVRNTIRTGREIGIGVDMTLGTGWPYGGPHIQPEHAPRKAELHHETLKPGAVAKEFSESAVEAALLLKPDGEAVPLTPEHPETLSIDVPPQGGELYLLLSRPTGQTVKRAAPGGAGPVMCPYSSLAFAQFIEPYTKMFAGADDRPRSVFYDSFEVFGSDVGPGMAGAFRKLTGRELATVLPDLAGHRGEERRVRARCDYRNALFTLLFDEGISSWVRWARDRGIQTRYQAHGAPGNLIDLYALSDIPETELFGATPFPWTDLEEYPCVVPPEYPLVNKLASSAAHLCGKPLTSSETFTWLREHFHTTLADLKPEADLLFLSGINHLFYHGSTHSPEEVPFPGWLFYASVHFDPRNTLWHDLPAFNRYVTRCQERLQAGRCKHTLLVYFPFNDILSLPDESLGYFLSVHHAPEFIGGMAWGREVLGLWNDGYDFDFVSDRLLSGFETDGASLRNESAAYKAILLPSCDTIPLATLKKLVALAETGTLVFSAGSLPESMPGLAGLDGSPEFQLLLEELARRVLPLEAMAAHGIQPLIHPPAAGVRAVRSVLDGNDRVFISNLSRETVDQVVRLGVPMPDTGWTLTDPVHGRRGQADAHSTEEGSGVTLQLAPGESVWLEPCDDTRLPPWPRKGAQKEAREIAGEWKVEALHGGPVLPPPTSIGVPVSWTDFDDPAWKDFSGTVRYRICFEMEPEADLIHTLTFPELAGSVRVELNGQAAGVVWCRPFELDISDFLEKSKNELVLDITHTSANRIAALDREGHTWSNFHEINVVSASYGPFDAASWPPFPSGLLRAPRVVSSFRIG